MTPFAYYWGEQDEHGCNVFRGLVNALMHEQPVAYDAPAPTSCWEPL